MKNRRYEKNGNKDERSEVKTTKMELRIDEYKRSLEPGELTHELLEPLVGPDTNI